MVPPGLRPRPAQREKTHTHTHTKSGKKMGGRGKWNLGRHTAPTRADAPVVDASVSAHDRHVVQVIFYHGALGDRKISIQSCSRRRSVASTGKKTW